MIRVAATRRGAQGRKGVRRVSRRCARSVCIILCGRTHRAWGDSCRLRDSCPRARHHRWPKAAAARRRFGALARHLWKRGGGRVGKQLPKPRRRRPREAAQAAFSRRPVSAVRAPRHLFSTLYFFFSLHRVRVCRLWGGNFYYSSPLSSEGCFT